MTKEQLYDYSEILADITYEVGYHRLRINYDSRTIISKVISWAEEFQERHKNTDWQEVEYLDTIYAFIEEKLGQYLYSIEGKCPTCPATKLRYEILNEPHLEHPYRIVCHDCGKVTEGEEAKEILLDALFDIYWNILWENGNAEWEIEPYLQKNLSIGKGLIPEEELLFDFQQWKEQNDLEFEKIQDTNHYSQI